MGKILLLVAFLLLLNRLTGQGLISLDRLAYEAPSQWTLSENEGYRTYAGIIQGRNQFCIISIYKADQSAGNPEKDFARAWAGIVEGHFKTAKSNTPRLAKTTHGLSYTWDEGTISNEKGSYFCRLLVFALGQQSQPVLFLCSSQADLLPFQAALDRFLASLQPSPPSDNPAASNGSTPPLTDQGNEIPFGHFRFRVPSGWNYVQHPDFLVLNPPGLASDEMLNFFLLSPRTDTSFEKTATSTLQELATAMGGSAFSEQIFGPGPLLEKENSGKFAKGWEYWKGHGRIRVGSRQENSSLIQYSFFYAGIFLVKIHERMERAVYISRDIRRGLTESSTYLKGAYRPVIKNFFFDLEFDDWKDEKMNPGKISGPGITGVWGGTAYFEGSAGNPFFEGSVKLTYLVFFDNGQVYYNNQLPEHGLNGLNSLVESQLYPRWWGTYSWDKGSGTIRLSYVTIPITLKKDQLFLGIYSTQIPYDRLEIPEHPSLSGHWCALGEFEGKKACISFTPDGRFNDQGGVRRMEHTLYDVYSETPESGTGSYEIRNYSIVFHFTGGTTYQAAFSPLNSQNKNPDPPELHLGFNDDLFQKQ
jgi:hypothetical protein